MDVSQIFQVNIPLSMLKIDFYPPRILSPKFYQKQCVTQFCLPLTDAYGPLLGLGMPAQGTFTQRTTTASHVFSRTKFSVTIDG